MRISRTEFGRGIELAVLSPTSQINYARNLRVRQATKVSKPLLGAVAGLDKPFRTVLSGADYAKVRRLGDEYLSHNPRCLASPVGVVR